MVPLPIVFALADAASRLAPPGVRVGMVDAPALPPSLCAAAAARARALAPAARWSFAAVTRRKHARSPWRSPASQGARAAFLEGDPPAGFAPWLTLTGCLPVLCAEIAPGERRRLPELTGWRRAWLIAAGPDGSFERDGETLPSWRVPVPCADERVALWHSATDEASSRARWARRIVTRPGASPTLHAPAASRRDWAAVEASPPPTWRSPRAAARAAISGRSPSCCRSLFPMPHWC